MKVRMLIGFFFICLGTLVNIAESSPTQWKVEDGGNDHWYEAILSPSIDWNGANQAANTKAGDWSLATITSEEENAFVLDLFKDQSTFWTYAGHSSIVGDVYAGPWIGGYSSSNSSNDWSWVTSEPFVYSAWGPYEPFSNGDRIYFSQFGNSVTIGWNDVPNYYTAPGYIVETADPIIPVPSSILLSVIGLISLLKIRRRI